VFQIYVNKFLKVPFLNSHRRFVQQCFVTRGAPLLYCAAWRHSSLLRLMDKQNQRSFCLRDLNKCHKFRAQILQHSKKRYFVYVAPDVVCWGTVIVNSDCYKLDKKCTHTIMYGRKKMACYSDSLRTGPYGVLNPVWARFSVSVQMESVTRTASCTVDTMSHSRG
jgi:hypothetical protein